MTMKITHFKGEFALFETVIPICHELKLLVDEYYRCENLIIKNQIQCDIKLLSEALFLCDQPA